MQYDEDFTGTEEEILERIRALRDRIRQLVGDFVIELLI